jgi:hypothetical protein
MAMKSFSGTWRGLAAFAAITLVLATPVAAHAAPARPAEAPTAPRAEAPTVLPQPAPAPPKGPLAQTGCTVTGASAVCDLWAKAGTLGLPGIATPGTVPIWGFASTDAGPATAPGPVLVVDEGAAVTIVLHNGLAKPLSLAVPAITGLIPDTAGAAPGGTKPYTFTAGRPGTYLYEAGHTTYGARQAAMGLVGALVVRAAAVGGKPTAYGEATSAYDDEALVVLTEVDPAFNANPLTYDLRAFNPTYRLINGKAFPETDVIATDINRTVLLRYLDAGLLPHPMTLLGVDQLVVGQDARPAAYPEGALTIALQPGQTLDAIVKMPTGPDGRKFALMESGGQLNNAGQRYGAVVAGVSPQQAFGGMLTFLDTNPPPDSIDHIGPVSSNIAASPNPTTVLVDPGVTVTANFSDALNGNSVVDKAELVIDDLSVGVGTSTMTFSSSAFGTGPTVTGATALIPTSVLTTLTQGLHTIFVRAHDVNGNWGVVGSTTLTLSSTGAATTGVVLTPNPTKGSTSVAVSASGDDSGLGGTITAAEFFVDATGANGSGTVMTLAATGAVSTSETGTIPAGAVTALAEGRHTVLVHTKDSYGLWGPYASADLVIDRTMPTLDSAAVVPAVTDGTNGSPSDPNDLRINATFTDPVSNAVNAPIAAAEGFLDSPGADGTGVTFVALDGTFNSAHEDTYGLVPLSQLTGLANGPHQVLVHARDAAGNWGPLVAATFTLQRGPVVSALTASPNPVVSNATLTLTATATSSNSTVTAAEWYDGTDPGVGHGTAMTVSGSALSANIAPGTLAVGTHTLWVRAKNALGKWGTPVSVTVTVQAPPNAIFADAFASLNTAAWSQTVGAPNATTGALVVQASGVGYVVNNTPAVERSYHAKFDFTVGTFNANTAIVDVFQGRNAAGTAVVNVQVRRSLTTTQFRLGLFRAGAWAYTGWTTGAGTVTIRVDWSSAVAGSGSLKVGGAAATTLSGDTSASVIESAALGLVVRSNTTPTGSATFDNFVSTRFTAP